MPTKSDNRTERTSSEAARTESAEPAASSAHLQTSFLITPANAIICDLPKASSTALQSSTNENPTSSTAALIDSLEKFLTSDSTTIDLAISRMNADMSYLKVKPSIQNPFLKKYTDYWFKVFTDEEKLFNFLNYLHNENLQPTQGIALALHFLKHYWQNDATRQNLIRQPKFSSVFFNCLKISSINSPILDIISYLFDNPDNYQIFVRHYDFIVQNQLPSSQRDWCQSSKDKLSNLIKKLNPWHIIVEANTVSTSQVFEKLITEFNANQSIGEKERQARNIILNRIFENTAKVKELLNMLINNKTETLVACFVLNKFSQFLQQAPCSNLEQIFPLLLTLLQEKNIDVKSEVASVLYVLFKQAENHAFFYAQHGNLKAISSSAGDLPITFHLMLDQIQSQKITSGFSEYSNVYQNELKRFFLADPSVPFEQAAKKLKPSPSLGNNAVSSFGRKNSSSSDDSSSNYQAQSTSFNKK